MNNEAESNALILLRERFNVSRETMRRFERFQEMLTHWSQSINLVAKETLPFFWSRHVLDSLGLFEQVSRKHKWLDIGTGSGFPLIPIAILNNEGQVAENFMSIESDQRKVAFLLEVNRELELKIDIIPKRVEEAPPCKACIISARALADVRQLLQYGERHRADKATLLFLKGRKVFDELTNASREWHMSYKNQTHPLTARGNILRIDEFGQS